MGRYFSRIKPRSPIDTLGGSMYILLLLNKLGGRNAMDKGSVLGRSVRQLVSVSSMKTGLYSSQDVCVTSLTLAISAT